MKGCQSFKQLQAIFVLLMCCHGEGVFASTLSCRQVFQVSKASISPLEITQTIAQMAQLQLLLDKSHTAGPSSQSVGLKRMRVDHNLKLKELEKRLTDIMTGEQIREAIKKEIMALQKMDREGETHRRQQTEALTEVLTMPKFQLSDKDRNIKVELENIPIREKSNRHDELSLEYLEDTNSLFTWTRGGVAEVVNLSTQQKIKLSSSVLTASLSANKKDLILISTDLKLERYDLVTLKQTSSTPLHVLRKPTEYSKDTYKLSISPSGKTVMLYSDFTDARVIEVFDVVSGDLLRREMSQGKWVARISLISDTAFVLAANESLLRKDFVLNKTQEVKLRSSAGQFSEDRAFLSVMVGDTLTTFDTKDFFVIHSQALKNNPGDFERIGIMNSFSAFERDFVIAYRKDNTQIFDQQSLEAVFNFGDRYSGEDRDILKIFFSRKKQAYVVIHEIYEEARDEYQRLVDFWVKTDK